MKIKNGIVVFIFLCISGLISAQSLGDFKEAYGGYGTKKLKKSQKKIYIAQFRTNFEVFKDASDYKAGGSMLGRGSRNGAKAKLALALDSINPADLKKMTNELYADYVKDLKAKGFQIVTAQEAEKAKSLEGYQMVNGGNVVPTDIPGFVTVTPEGHNYFIKGVDKNGVEKKKYSLVGDADMKLNKKIAGDLGGILVAKVDLYLMFSDQKQGWSPGGAKVKIKTNLRMVGATTVTAEKKKGLRFKGAFTTHPIRSMMAITDSKGNSYDGSLKKPLEIEGVIEKQTIKASQSNGMYRGATSFSYATSDKDTTSRKFQTIPVDPSKYALAAKMVMKKFLDFHLSGFNSKF